MRNFTLFVLGWLLMLPVCAQSSKDVLWEDFREGTTDAGWTVIDGNSDGNTWGTQENLKGMVYNGLATTTPAEDWAFTPEFTLKNSSDYVIEYTVAQRGAFGADQLQLYLSTTPTLDNLTQLRAEETVNVHAGTVTRKCHFVAPMSGTFYLGFKLTSTAGNGLISIKAVKVTLTNKQCPQIASAFTASHNGATGKVKLKWIAPNRDTEGALLQGKLTANVYQDEQQLTTIEDITPGVEASYEITPAAASGQTRFGIAFRNDTQISARADKTLNLEDVLGDPVKLKSFSLSTKAAFAEWTVINNDNKGAVWAYDYGSAYIPYAATADDWLITPVANVEKGKRYILKYQIKTSVGYPANMEVTVGNAATVAAQTQVVYTHTGVEQNGWGDYETSQFVPNEDGEAYFAFHATMVKNQLCVRNVELYYIEATAAGTEEEEISYTEPAEEVLKDSINADLTFTTPYHERLGSEGVNLYCAVTQGLIDEYTSCPNGIFKMDPAKQYQPNLASPDYEMLFAGGVVYWDGKLYTNAYDYRNDIQAEVPIWRVMDAKTLVTISEHRLPSNAECTTRALAYDPVTEKIFAIGRDYTNDWLAVVDPATGAMQRLGTGLDPNKRYLAIGCDSKGVLVCVYLVEDYKTGNQYNYIGRINKETGEIVEMGEIQARNMMTDDMIVNMKYRQSLFFDNATGKLYWMLCSSSMALGSQYAPVFELDPVSCTATLRTWATNIMAVSGAYFEEPAMNVPASPSDFNYEPDGEGLVTGTISFKMPTTCYDGSPLAGTLHYSVVEEEVMELTGTAQPGETVSRHIESFNGLHTVTLTASNAAGTSVAIERTFLVGYDMPDAPANIKLTDNGDLTTTVTWDAPELGINGKAYDASKLTYNVVRYPDKVKVATGLTERTFTESHGADYSYYFYAVYSCSDGLEIKGERSNTVVVGAPLTPPYGGIFTTADAMFNYYTILDENHDGYTWSHDSSSGAAVYPYNYQLGADDWFISPGLSLEAKKNYALTFSTFSSNENFPEALKVMFGHGKDPEEFDYELLDLPEVPTIDEENRIATYTLPVTITNSGTYFYGFYAYSPAYSEYLYLYDINFTVSTAEGISKATAEAKAFDAYAKGGKLFVLNPSGKAVSVYNAGGTQLVNTTATRSELPVTPGVYVVKSGSQSLKVLVK